MSDSLQKKSSLDKWRCSKCFFDNLELMTACEICEEPREKDAKSDTMSSLKPASEPGITCPDTSCKHFNPLSRDTCEKC